MTEVTNCDEMKLFTETEARLCRQLKLEPHRCGLYEAQVIESGEIVFAFFVYKREMYKFICGRVFHIGHFAHWVDFARCNGTIKYDDYTPPFCREVVL